MTKRDHAIARARIAGYHDDKAAFTRLIIESRVNRATMNEAWHNGKAAKAGGMGCHCHECAKAKAGDNLPESSLEGSGPT